MAVFVKLVLFVIAIVYGLIIRALILFQSLQRYRLGSKVISVGNITLGGTGKTPLVEIVARYLKQKGCKIAVLTRGYKRNKEAMGDEPTMLMNNLEDVPVIVDADRVRSAKRAIKEYGVNAVILDDGFQQWRIKKDLEIVVIDATCPFGNRYMIPRGILREPLSSLKRADIFVLTKTNLNPDTQKTKDLLHSINPQALISESIHRPVGLYDIRIPEALLGIDCLRGKTVALVAGIADPYSFENIIKGLGTIIGLSLWFADHYAYQAKDIQEIITHARNKNIDTIITTEKDAARIQSGCFSSEVTVLVLKIELQITNHEKEFFNRVCRVCAG